MKFFTSEMQKKYSPRVALLRLRGFSSTAWDAAKARFTTLRAPDATRSPDSFLRLSLEERILFAKRLSVLLKAGVPILEGLRMLQKQTDSRAAKAVFEDLTRGVERGQFLHVCLEKYRRHFGDFAINIVRVGEITGSLHENLLYLAEETRKKRELKRKVVGALIYPILIVVATIGITILLITNVFPKILPVLQTFKGELPITTRTLIWVSHLFVTSGWLIALFFIAIVATITVSTRKSERFRLRIHTILLRLPVVGRLFRSYHAANFCRTLGILLKSNSRIVESIGVTASTSTNLAYRNALRDMREVLLKGGKLSTALERYPRLFSPMVSQMVTVGETTGSLSDSLIYLAEIYEQEVDDLTKNLSTAVEPMLMIFMGLLVGFIAMSIITPIYSFTQTLSR